MTIFVIVAILGLIASLLTRLKPRDRRCIGGDAQRPIVGNSRVGDGSEDGSVRLEHREHLGDLELVPFDLRVLRGPWDLAVLDRNRLPQRSGPKGSEPRHCVVGAELAHFQAPPVRPGGFEPPTRGEARRIVYEDAGSAACLSQISLACVTSSYP